MKKFLLILLCLVPFSFSSKAQSVMTFDLPAGQYGVGFKTNTIYDEERTYEYLGDGQDAADIKEGARPIHLSIWYPAEVGGQQKMKYGHYLDLFKRDRERTAAYISGFVNNGKEEEERNAVTWAVLDAEGQSGKFPVVIYAPSFNAPSFENSVLCEYLASHGYIVIASPSQGNKNRLMTADYLGANAQAKDIEVLMEYMKDYPSADWDKMAIMGFSWGGLSNVIAQMRNNTIDAILSLDGSVTYFYNAFKQWPGTDLDKVNVPFMLMAQKSFRPKMFIRGDSVNTQAPFDSSKYSSSYLLKYKELVHQNFGAHFVKLRARDYSLESDQVLINKSYQTVSQYALNFFDAHLKKKSKSSKFLRNTPEQNGVQNGLMTIERKKPLRKR